MPDPTSRIRFSSVFPKKAWIILCKTDPDPIWMALARFGQTHLVWKQAVVQELSGPVSGRTQPAPLPVSRFQIRFRSSTDVPDNTVQNQPGSGLILADCVRFWPNGSGPEASRCAGIIWPGFWHEAPGPLPVSDFLTRFRSSTDDPDNTVQNQPGSDLVVADCVRFWPNGSGPEASRCARIIRPASGQCFRADPDRIRIGSGVFNNNK